MKFLVNSQRYEYDIRGLLMAFYPWTDFSIDPEAEDTDCLETRFEENGDLTIDFSVGDRSYGAFLPLSELPQEERKSVLKRKLYEILSEANGGKTLPWGTLTGIRPTKIALTMLYDGASDGEVLRHMQDDLYCSREKSELSLGIAKREKNILSDIDTKEGYSIYIGIPFCPTTCLYCSFTSFPIRSYRKKVWDYLRAVEKELIWISEAFRDRPLHTVYFGGGTPTTLEPEELQFLFEIIMDRFDLSNLREWTVEGGRPDSITREKLQMIRRYPITRISINPQTMHQRTLDLIGRHHTVEDVRAAFRMAREEGFDNINMDLILGLPGETDADVKETIRRVIEMDPENITIHSLALKRASRLNLLKDEYAPYRMENTEETMDYCRDEILKTGQTPYYLYRQKNMAGNLENTGYARPGKAGIYNILIMEEVETIVACGAGATTKFVQGDRITRAENLKNVDLYIAGIDEMIERKRKLFGDFIPNV